MNSITMRLMRRCQRRGRPGVCSATANERARPRPLTGGLAPPPWRHVLHAPDAGSKKGSLPRISPRQNTAISIDGCDPVDILD